MEKDDMGNRWWEFYFVRYAMGTVIGAVIILVLAQNAVISNALDIKNISTINGSFLWILGAYGLAFCYISSGPILVIHATRFTKFKFTKGVCFGILVCLIAIAGLTWSAYLYSSWCNSLGLKDSDLRILRGLFTFIALVLGIFISYQVIKVINTYLTICDGYTYYYNLALRRETDSSGFVQSYRHLREHGNSFFIVIFEILLGAILFTFGNLPIIFGSSRIVDKGFYVLFPDLTIIFIWIVPAVLIYLLGLRWEKEFADRSQY